MATIYAYIDQVLIADGLPSASVSDQAIQTASALAAMRQGSVVIDDDGEFTIVRPDGMSESMDAEELEDWL